MTREAHAFLHEHGCINTGVMGDEPPAGVAKLSDEELAWRTRQILKAADMQVHFSMCLPSVCACLSCCTSGH
jgi:hypothetical protein